MSTKPGIPDHFTAHDMRERFAATGNAIAAEQQPVRPALLVNAPETPPAGPPRRYVVSPEDAGVHITRAHVATLPDGTRVNLPAGTVLREGEIERRSLPPINLNDALVRLAHGECDSAEKAALMHFIRCWHQPSREVIARDLLQRARVLLVETGGADVLAEVDAFLAGAPPK